MLVLDRPDFSKYRHETFCLLVGKRGALPAGGLMIQIMLRSIADGEYVHPDLPGSPRPVLYSLS